MKKTLFLAAAFLLVGVGCGRNPDVANTNVPPVNVPPVNTPVDVNAPGPATSTNTNANTNTPTNTNTNRPATNANTNQAPAPVTKNVTIQNFAFAPASVTVKKGDKVVFTNQDTAGHTATADNGAFDSGILQKGQSFTLNTANLAAGTYTYFCRPHPNMRGTIVVQ